MRCRSYETWNIFTRPCSGSGLTRRSRGLLCGTTWPRCVGTWLSGAHRFDTCCYALATQLEPFSFCYETLVFVLIEVGRGLPGTGQLVSCCPVVSAPGKTLSWAPGPGVTSDPPVMFTMVRRSPEAVFHCRIASGGSGASTHSTPSSGRTSSSTTSASWPSSMPLRHCHDCPTQPSTSPTSSSGCVALTVHRAWMQ